ncbi:MAG TPA: hypothetical protein VGN72_00285 [Tepidisphaeraceae bacterium]|nr:hypothetical protein [Tepidisphaeraceae bacterium]
MEIEPVTFTFEYRGDGQGEAGVFPPGTVAYMGRKPIVEKTPEPEPIEKVRKQRRWLRPVCWMMFLGSLVVAGCVNEGKLVPASNITGESIVRADVRRTHAINQIEIAKPHTVGPYVVNLDTATTELFAQGDDLKAAAAALQAERVAHANTLHESQRRFDELKADHDKLNGRWFVVVGQYLDGIIKWIMRWFWWLLTISIVLRAVALALPGPVGAVLATISTVGFGILSGGISLITSAADNWFFRKIKGGS